MITLLQYSFANTEVSPFMQSFNFACGLGGLIAPIIAEPFLVESEKLISSDELMSMNSTLNLSERGDDGPDLLLVYPYSIDAFLLAVASCILFLTWMVSPNTEEHPSRKSHLNNNSSSDMTTVNDTDNTLDKSLGVSIDLNNALSSSPLIFQRNIHLYKIVVIALALLFSHIYYGLLLAFGSFLVSFVVESDLSLSKKEGTRLTSLFWGTFTFWRLTTLFYHEFVGNENLIIMSLLIVIAGNIVLIPFGNSSVICLWIGVGVIGLGISSVWSAMFGYLEEHFPVTSRIASGMIISALLGEFIFPLIISYFIQSNPEILLWITLFCSVSLAIIFAFQMFVMRRKLKFLRESKLRTLIH
jgi:hypothetical protein